MDTPPGKTGRRPRQPIEGAVETARSIGDEADDARIDRHSRVSIVESEKSSRF
jgi:hypothetical protein